jgi:hypothetical protein
MTIFRPKSDFHRGHSIHNDTLPSSHECPHKLPNQLLKIFDHQGIPNEGSFELLLLSSNRQFAGLFSVARRALYALFTSRQL